MDVEPVRKDTQTYGEATGVYASYTSARGVDVVLRPDRGAVSGTMKTVYPKSLRGSLGRV